MVKEYPDTFSLVSDPPEYKVECRIVRARTTPSWPMSICDFCIVFRFHTLRMPQDALRVSKAVRQKQERGIPDFVVEASTIHCVVCHGE